MVIINSVGYDFALLYRGQKVVIPSDNHVYTVPDDFGFFKELKVLVPPKPIIPKMENVVDITDKVIDEAKPNEKINKPLQGKKAKKRKKILKDAAGKKFSKRILEGNNK